MLAALGRHIETEMIDYVVIDEQIECDCPAGVFHAGRKFIRGQHLRPDAGVIKFELVAGDDPRLVERVGFRSRCVRCRGPVYYRFQKMASRASTQFPKWLPRKLAGVPAPFSQRGLQH